MVLRSDISDVLLHLYSIEAGANELLIVGIMKSFPSASNGSIG